MKKEAVRKKFSSLRENLSERELNKLSLDLFKNSKTLPIWDKGIYHIFLPIEKKKELNTYPIIGYLWSKNKKVCLPKMSLKKNMHCFFFEKNTPLEPNNYGIYEPTHAQKIDPKELDVCFVPLLAFDLGGHRVGYGGGFYDKFFKNCKKNLLKIGLSLFDPIDKIEDIQESDVRLNGCVTPNKTYIF